MPTIALVLLALQLVVVATPFALELIPANSVLGLRVPSGPGHDRAWYEANSCYGRDLIRLGAVLAVIALGCDGMGFPTKHAHAAWFAMAIGGFVLVTMEARLRATEIAERVRAAIEAGALPDVEREVELD